MSYDPHQFHDLITRVTREISLYSPEAVELLLGTAAQESQLGTYLRQLGSGPALGAFQIEPSTFHYLRDRYQTRFPFIWAFQVYQLEYDLRASIVIARLKYYSCPGAVPKDLNGQAQYWKRWYNTPLGAGTVEEYIASYYKYVQQST